MIVLPVAAVPRRRGRGGGSARAAPAQARARAAGEVRRGQAAARTRRSSTPQTAPAARAAAAGAARGGAACCWRWRSRGRSSRPAPRPRRRRDRRRARHVATACRRPAGSSARSSSREEAVDARAGRRRWSASSTFADRRAIWSRSRRADRALALAAIDRRAAGFGATRYRAALSTPPAERSAAAAARSSSSPICRRADGTRATRVACPSRRASRSPTSARCPPNLAVIGRPVGRRSRRRDRAATPARARARPRVRLTRRRPARGRDDRCRSGRIVPADVTFRACRGGDAAAVAVDDRDGTAGRQRPVRRARRARRGRRCSS